MHGAPREWVKGSSTVYCIRRAFTACHWEWRKNYLLSQNFVISGSKCFFWNCLWVCCLFFQLLVYVCVVIWHSCLRKQMNLEYKICCISSEGIADFGEQIWQETRRTMSEKDNSSYRTGNFVESCHSTREPYFLKSRVVLGNKTKYKIQEKSSHVSIMVNPLGSAATYPTPLNARPNQFEYGTQDFPFKKITQWLIRGHGPGLGLSEMTFI